MPKLIDLLSSEQMVVFQVVKAHCEGMLDGSPRFKYFTLHGKSHIENLISISDLLIDGGLILSQEEAYLFALSICLHDIGMVVPLSEKNLEEIFEDRAGSLDAANIELLIRRQHHELVSNYISKHFCFLTDIGVSPSTIGMVQDICRSHRVVDLDSMGGYAKDLGGLLRMVDELDVSPNRAPSFILENFYEEMDSTSCWHWLKHSITQDWLYRDNVSIEKVNGRNVISFKLIMRPPSQGSVRYWIKQSLRSINRVMFDEGAQKIVKDRWGVEIKVSADYSRSRMMHFNDTWVNIEKKSLTSNKRTILLIDDEHRKMEDLLLDFSDDYNIVCAVDAKSAFMTLEANNNISLAIVDMQIGSGGLWDLESVGNGKTTGIKICNEIRDRYPEVKVGVLTASRHSMEGLDKGRLSFFLKKPVELDEFVERLRNVLQ